MWLSLRFLLSFYLLKGFFSSFSSLLLRVKGRGCHTLLKPYETNCGLWIWAIQIKFDWLIDRRGYALSPNMIPFGRLVWSSLYRALSLRMRASWTDPGHFTTQFVMRSSALPTSWTLMLCLPFRFTNSHSFSWGAYMCTWLQSIAPIVLGIFPKRKKFCLAWMIWSSFGNETNSLIRLANAVDTLFRTSQTVDFVTPM